MLFSLLHIIFILTENIISSAYAYMKQLVTEGRKRKFKIWEKYS